MTYNSRTAELAAGVRDTINLMVPRLMPDGGVAGQFLRKKSNSPYDVEWVGSLIDNGSITLAKLGGDITAAGKALLDDATPAAQRTTLGLGSAALSQIADFAPAIHGHSISQITGLQAALDAAIPISKVTGLQAALDAKFDASLLSTFGKSFVALANGAAARTALGLDSAALRPDTYFARSVHTHSASQIEDLQGLLDQKLSVAQVTPFVQSLFDEADAAAFRTSIGLGSAASASASDFATANHTHTAATSSAPGFMSVADKIKLLGIEAGATVNSTDAQLRDRSTHTGTQAIATVAGLEAALSSKLAANLVSAYGLTLAASASASAARDVLGLGSAALVAASSFAAAGHSHVIADVTGLAAALALLAPKAAPSFTSGITVAGQIVTDSNILVQGNRVIHAGDAINATTLGGVAASGYALAGHTHNEFATITSALAGKEATIAAGTTAQYWRGDKTWQALNKGAVGLSSVDNTSDADKPVSVAQQTAINLRAPLANPIFSGTPRVGAHKIFHEGNDGEGSGLDADTIRGLAPSAFAAASHSHDYAPILHTHAMADISGLAGALALLAPIFNPVFTGHVSLSGDPVNPLHAATKQYVDNAIEGLGTKHSVLCATTASIVLSGEQLIDGVLAMAGARVLVMHQTDASKNGIYVVQDGAWTRASDMDAWSEIRSAFVFIESGTTLGGSGWVASAAPNGTLGTSPVTWTQFSGAGTYTAAGGITKTGSEFRLADMPSQTLKGNLSGSSAAPQDVTLAQVAALLPVFSSSTSGIVPASGGGSTKYLRADGQWSTPYGVWGSITGSITAQTDLQAALALKASSNSPSFSNGVTVSTGGLVAASVTANHQLGNLVIANGTGGSPLLRSKTDTPAIFLGSALRMETNLSAKLTAGSSVTSHMIFETSRGATNGFKWFTAPVTTDVLVEQMFLTSTGNLGLGKTPTERLDVVGNIRATGDLYSGSNRVWHAGDSINAALLGGIEAAGYARAQHVHAITDITGLRAELDAKVPAIHSHDMGEINGLAAALAAKENFVPSGTVTQYYRGDKTWQPLTKGVVGLALVDNTSDANKPISDATQAALNQKLDATHAGLGGAVHAVATISAAGFMSAADKVKLNGIATGATANATDAQLRDRSTHTGSQAMATITGLSAALEGKADKGSVSTSGLTMATTRLLGRYSADVGAVEEISLGGGLSLSGGILDVTITPEWGNIGGQLADQTDLQTALDEKLNADQKGANGGVATLGGDGKIPFSQIPAIAISSVTTVESEAAQLALTAQVGDMVIRTDLDLTYIHNGGTAGTMADWTEIKSRGGVVSVNGETGAVTLTKEDVVTLDSGKILGRTTAGTGTVEEISVGVGLTMSGGTLSLASGSTVYEPAITAGTTAQYWRGDKTWQSLDKAAVGLGNLDNTSDAAKPISDATQDALDLKANLNHTHDIEDVVGLQGALDNKAPLDHSHDISDVAGLQSALDSTQPLDATLTALAALDSAAGLLEQTGADTFAKRAIGVASATDILTRGDGDTRFASRGAVTASGLTMATARLLGRTTAATGAVEELSATSVTAFLNVFGTTTKGLVPAPGTVANKFLRDDGSWQTVEIETGWAPVTATGTGSSQNITLPESGLLPSDVMVFVNGSRWNSNEYSISGTTLTLTSNASGDLIEIVKPSGATGPQGPQGPAGPAGFGGSWGSINGTLSDQIDLLNALNAKANLSGASFTGNVSSSGDISAVGSMSATSITATGDISGANFVKGSYYLGSGGIPNATDGWSIRNSDGLEVGTSGVGRAFIAPGYDAAQPGYIQFNSDDGLDGFYLGLLNANNRANLSTFGGITGIEFDQTPYVGLDRIFHAGNLSFGTGLTFAGGTLSLTPTSWSNPVTETGTGASQNITLPESGLTPQQVLVFVNGMRWETDEYSISGTTLTLTTNAAGASIEIVKPVGASAYTPSAVSTQASATYTAVLADAQTYRRFTSSSAVTFTIPPNASVAFPVGTEIEVEQTGTGVVTFAPGSGVTINSRGNRYATNGRYAVAVIKKVGTNEWTLRGDVI